MRNDQKGILASAKPQKAMACTNCRKKKIKCDGKIPSCNACARNKQSCIYVLSRRRGRPSRAGKELERNINSLPKLLPKMAIAPELSEQEKFSSSLEHTKSPESAQPITSSSFLISEQAHSLQQISQNNNQINSNSLLNNHNYFQPLENDENDNYTTYIIKHRRSSCAYENKDSENYSQSIESSSFSRNYNKSSKKPRLSGIGSVAKMISSHNTFVATMVPVIPIHIKSKVYNEPDVLLYFHYFNTQYPIIHYPSFREEYDDGTVPNYLVMAIKAIGRRYSKQPSVVLSDNLPLAGLDLSAIATSLAEIAMQQDPNTSLIQTLMILSIFEFGIGKPNRAYDRRNSAIKISYKLGINLLDSGGRERKERSLITAESCRRLWWILLYSDRLFSFISSISSIRPVIDESLFRVDIPYKLVDYYIPNNSSPEMDMVYQTTLANKEFGRFDDYEVVNWFHSITPLTLIIGHIVYQRQAAYRIFNSNVLSPNNTESLIDVSWKNALSEFLRNMLVIDAEINLWKSELDENKSKDSDSILKMSRYHRKLQLHGVIIYHQFLVLYAFEKLKPYLKTFSATCTPVLWLKTSAKSAWCKIASSTEYMQTLAQKKYHQLISNNTSGSIEGHEWEYCAPHVSFFLYMAVKVCISFSHWMTAYKKIKASSKDSNNFANQEKSPQSYYFNNLIGQLFNNAEQNSDLIIPELDKTILEIEEQISTFIDLIKVCSKYWNDRDYVKVLQNLTNSPHLFTDLTETIETILLEIGKKLF
ncbi:hypothetical protein BB561_005596 [Smittium simulii]|uniref:Zn(2)-C6 fungal-type domain-containing protein n=1 Tax=Smittium simulii TaxID=133385 RepID=A0A2T9Y9L0_9FUNG|nr:hypothetical protein BB561_005596 [Smittium simulii]